MKTSSLTIANFSAKILALLCLLLLVPTASFADKNPKPNLSSELDLLDFATEVHQDSQFNSGVVTSDSNPSSVDDAFTKTYQPIPAPLINADVAFANNRLLALPGTSYYLRHDDIVPESIIIQVEVRDKTQATLATYPLADKKDYGFDADTSELKLNKPAYYAIDQYWYGDLAKFFIFLNISYQYIDQGYEVSIDQDFVSLNGGVSWFVEDADNIIQEQSLAANFSHDYGVVKHKSINLGAPGHKVYTPSNTLLDGFLIGIVDSKVTRRNITGNRALGGSGNPSFNKTLLTEGKVQIHYRGMVKGEYLVNASLDTQRSKDDILNYIDPDLNYAVYGDESTISDLSKKANGLLYLLVEKGNSWVEWGQVQAQLPSRELTEFNRSIDGLGVHTETQAVNKQGIPKTTTDFYYAQLEEKRTRNELLSTGSVIYYLKFTSVRSNSIKLSLEVRDHNTGRVIRTQTLAEGTDFDLDANAGRILFNKPIKQYVSSGIIAADGTDTNDSIYIIAEYNYQVSSTDLNQSVKAIRVQQAINDNLVLGVQHQAEDQADSDFESSAVDANILVGKKHTFDLEYAQSNLSIEAPYTSNDGGITYQQADSAKVIGSKTDDAFSFKGIYDNDSTDKDIKASYYYKKVANDFSQKTSSNQAGKKLAGYDTKYILSKNTNLRLKFDISKDIDRRINKDWTDNQNIAVQSEHQYDDKLTLTTAYSGLTTKAHTKDTTGLKSTNKQNLAIKGDYKLSPKTDLSLRQQITIKGEDNNQTTIGAKHKVTKNLKVSGDTTFHQNKNNASNAALSYALDNGLAIDLGTSRNSSGVNTTRLGGQYSQDGVSLGAGVSDDSESGNKTDITGAYSKDNISVSAGVDQNTQGELTHNTGGKYKFDAGSQTYNVSAHNQNGANTTSSQAYVLGVDSPIGDKTQVGLDTTLNVSGDNVRNSIGSNISHQFNKKQSVKAKLSRYTENENGKVGDGFETKVSGQLDENWAVDISLGQGYVQNASNTQDRRTSYGAGVAYVNRNAQTGDILKSSLAYQLRTDSGIANKSQESVDAKLSGKYSQDLTLLSTIKWSETQNENTNTTDARSNRFDLNAAYRPLKHNRFNGLFKYTKFSNLYTSGQIQENGLSAESGDVLSSDLFYKVYTDWQIGTRLARRLSKEKFNNQWFDNTVDLVALLAQYEVVKDTFISLEFRTLNNKRAEDKKDGLVLEVKRRFSDYIEGAVGYNWAGYQADLAALDYNVEGWYLRATGVIW